MNSKAAAPATVEAVGFIRSNRLLRHADFELVYKQGRRHFEKHMTVFYLSRPEPGNLRIGITVSRALGGAVTRNRIRRRLREAIRAQFPLTPAPVDIVINPKKSLFGAEFSELLKEVGQAFGAILKQAVRS